MSNNPFCIHLIERWRTGIFGSQIYPDAPFRNGSWVSLAFNRDNHGDLRLPSFAWTALVNSLQSTTHERTAFICSPDPITGGSVHAREQPFMVSLDEECLLNHFKDMSNYLPSFYMLGASEKWALWGDSDFTLIGGEKEIIHPLVSAFGGADAALMAMYADFGVDASSGIDEEMQSYLSRLLRLA